MSGTSFLKQHRRFFAIALLLVAAAVIFSYVDPADIVSRIGIKNIYAAVFLFAVVGGVSAVTATSFYATLFAFALGGANPFLLALFSAPGVLIGDLAFWYLGHKGKSIARPVVGSMSDKISLWLSKKPHWMIPVAAYIYTGFSPLPGEFLMVTRAILGVPLRRIVIPTLLGNFTLAILIVSSAAYGFRGAPFLWT